MAMHSLYPGFVKLIYTGNGHIHKQIIPVLPFQAVGGDWWLEKKDVVGGSEWTSLIDAYVLLLKPLLNTADEIQTAELWTLASETADPVFVTEYALAVAGTSVSAPAANGQLTMVHRTVAGGLYRWYLMEGAYGTATRVFPPLVPGTYRSMSDYIKGSGSFFAGRDGSFCSSLASLTTKVNDALRKKYFLAS